MVEHIDGQRMALQHGEQLVHWVSSPPYPGYPGYPGRQERTQLAQRQRT